LTSIDEYLHGALATTLQPLLPHSSLWFDRPEEAVVRVSVFRVFRVPYDTKAPTGLRVDLGQAIAVFTNINLPYFKIASGFDPRPDGSVVPKGELLGWEATNRGLLLLLMSPMRSDGENLDPEAAVQYRIDATRAVIVAILGINAAFEQVCEFSINYEDVNRASISITSGAMENPGMHEVPDIGNHSAFEQIASILTGIESLDTPTQNRIRLALRWYQRALRDRRILKMGAGDVA
jgi:hypothetical protein